MANRKRWVFVVTHLFPQPATHGTELRILKLLVGLRSAGYKVALVLTEEPQHNEHLQGLRHFVDDVRWIRPAWRTRLGRRLPGLRRLVWQNLKNLTGAKLGRNENPKGLYEPVPSTLGHERSKRVCPPQLAVLVSRLARKHQPVAVIAEYIFLTDCFALLKPDILKVIDTIDVFSLRSSQVLGFGIEHDPWNTSAEEERAYLLRADVIIAIQAREARVLRELVPERNVLTVGIDFDVMAGLTDEQVNTNLIMVVASDSPLNVHGLTTFLVECWPQIKHAHPAVRLHIVGTIGRRCRVEDESIEYTPRAEDLSTVYREARVVINPTMAGTGLKVKSAEALAHGKPLVAWPLGVDGLDYEGETPYLKCDSWEEFGAAVVRLLKSDTLAEQMGRRALGYATERFNQANTYAPLHACLNAHAEGGRLEALINLEPSINT